MDFACSVGFQSSEVLFPELQLLSHSSFPVAQAVHALGSKHIEKHWL